MIVIKIHLSYFDCSIFTYVKMANIFIISKFFQAFFYLLPHMPVFSQIDCFPSPFYVCYCILFTVTVFHYVHNFHLQKLIII